MSLAVERHGKAMNAGWLRRSLQREREMFGRRYQGTIETRCQYVLAQVARRFTNPEAVDMMWEAIKLARKAAALDMGGPQIPFADEWYAESLKFQRIREAQKDGLAVVIPISEAKGR